MGRAFILVDLRFVVKDECGANNPNPVVYGLE
jgi:hypothetical protein